MIASPYLSASAAATYDRLAVPLQFAAPARDLVAGLGLSVGSRVLDVGTGTGAALIRAGAHVGASGWAVGLDVSIEMLRALRQKAAHPVVVAHAERLPFAEGCFDAVFASFVLSHIKDYQRTLADIVRILRRTGRLGVTAWGPAPTMVAQAWEEVTAAFVSSAELLADERELIPWADWFSRAGNLRHALEEAGLDDVEVTRRGYRVTISVADYLSLRANSVDGTLLCQRLTAEEWNQFQQRVADLFRSRFGATLDYIREVHFGFGTKPTSVRRLRR